MLKWTVFQLYVHGARVSFAVFGSELLFQAMVGDMQGSDRAVQVFFNDIDTAAPGQKFGVAPDVIDQLEHAVG